MSLFSKISIFTVLISIFGCNTENAEKLSFVEEIPVFEAADFDAVQVSEQLISIVPSDFSIKLMPYKKVIFTGGNLFKEQHISIEQLNDFTDSKMSSQRMDSLFAVFAENQIGSFQKILKENDGFALEATSDVDEASTIRYVGSGKSFGFPIKKYFFVRFYNFDSNYFKVSSWSVDSVEMNRIAKIFELSLERN